MTEEWRDVVGWEGFYEVSSRGRVRTVARQIGHRFGSAQLRSRIRTQQMTPKGYMRVQLTRTEEEGCRVRRGSLVHVLVAEAFLPPAPQEKHDIGHLDGNRTNNHVQNLAWQAESKTAQSAYDSGKKQKPVKYNVRCVTLGIETVGCPEMSRELAQRGIAIDSSCIRRCVTGEYRQFKGLEFSAEVV